MSIFKRVAKKTYGSVIKPGFKKTIGRGARSAPGFKDVLRAANRINPVRGYAKVTKALAPKQRRRRGIKGPAPRKRW